MATATTISDLVAMVSDRVNPAGLVDRSEVERLVREHRTERYEAHDEGSEALTELCEKVAADLAAAPTEAEKAMAKAGATYEAAKSALEEATAAAKARGEKVNLFSAPADVAAASAAFAAAQEARWAAVKAVYDERDAADEAHAAVHGRESIADD